MTCVVNNLIIKSVKINANLRNTFKITREFLQTIPVVMVIHEGAKIRTLLFPIIPNTSKLL